MVGGVSREVAQKTPTGNSSLLQRGGEGKANWKKLFVLIQRLLYSLLAERRCHDSPLSASCCLVENSPKQSLSLWAQAASAERAVVTSGEKAGPNAGLGDAASGDCILRKTGTVTIVCSRTSLG